MLRTMRTDGGGFRLQTSLDALPRHRGVAVRRTLFLFILITVDFHFIRVQFTIFRIN